MNERPIAGADLIASLPSVLDDISANGVTYLVNLGPADPDRLVVSGMVRSSGDVVFALGRPDDLGRVIGLVDPEYGWPRRVEFAAIAAVGDVAPGYRSHPMIYRDGKCVAMSVSWWEYQRIRGTGGEGAGPGAATRGPA